MKLVCAVCHSVQGPSPRLHLRSAPSPLLLACSPTHLPSPPLALTKHLNEAHFWIQKDSPAGRLFAAKLGRRRSVAHTEGLLGISRAAGAQRSKTDAHWGQVALHKQLALVWVQRQALVGIGNWRRLTCHLIKPSVPLITPQQQLCSLWLLCVCASGGPCTSALASGSFSCSMSRAFTHRLNS